MQQNKKPVNVYEYAKMMDYLADSGNNLVAVSDNDLGEIYLFEDTPKLRKHINLYEEYHRNPALFLQNHKNDYIKEYGFLDILKRLFKRF